MYATQFSEGSTTADMFEQHGKALATNFYRSVKPPKQELFYPKRIIRTQPQPPRQPPPSNHREPPQQSYRYPPPPPSKPVLTKPNRQEYLCPATIVPTAAEELYLKRLRQQNARHSAPMNSNPTSERDDIVVNPVPVMQSSLATTQTTVQHPLRTSADAPYQPPSPVLKRTAGTRDKRSILWDPLIPSRVTFSSSYGQIELTGTATPHEQILQSTEDLLSFVGNEENKVPDPKQLERILEQVQVSKSQPFTIETPAIETGNELIILQLQCHQDQTAQVVLYNVERGKATCSIHSTGPTKHSGKMFTLSFQVEDLYDEDTS